ncbi:poly(A)-binding protein binding protein [Rhodotorula kratochvilovae]
MHTKRGAQSPAQDRLTWLLLALVGHSVVATVKGGVRVRGILAAATPDGADLSLALRHASYLHDPPATPPKPSVLITGRDLLALEAVDAALDFGGSAPAASNGVSRPASAAARDSFRTDTDISGGILGKERQLQAWGIGGGADDSGWGAAPGDDSLEGGIGGLPLEDDMRRSGKGAAGGKGWDQFAVNESRFGLKTDYDDEIYTTKLDRSGNDFKAREARAAQLEKEILKGTSPFANNAHVAEERGEQAPDSLNEEDRYGAVIRAEGAYVPPGARKAALARLQNGSSATAAASRTPPVVSGTPAAPAINAPSAVDNNKGLQHQLQSFVVTERVRLEQKKEQIKQAQQAQQQAQARKEQDSKLASLLQWSQTFKNPYPLPDDLAVVMGKKPAGDQGQKALSTASNASPAVSPANTNRTLPAISPSPTPSASTTSVKTTSALQPKAKPFIAEIPPFNPARAKVRQGEPGPIKVASPLPAAPAAAPTASTSKATSPSVAAATLAVQVKAPTTKLSATSAAFVFKPNPSAATFTPGASVRKPASPAPPAAPVEAPAPVPVNPFFGTKVIKKGSSSMHVKEDFTPFKNGVLPEPSSIIPSWPGFTGKPYRAIYPPQAVPLGFADEAAVAQLGAPPSGMMDPNSAAAIAAAQQAHQAQLQAAHHHQAQAHAQAQAQAQAQAAAAMMHGGQPPPPPPPMGLGGPFSPAAAAAMAAAGFRPPPPGAFVPPPQHPHQQQHPHLHAQHPHQQYPNQRGPGGIPPPPPPPFGQFAGGPGQMPPFPPGSAPMFTSPNMQAQSPHAPHAGIPNGAPVPQPNGPGGPGGRPGYMPWAPPFVPVAGPGVGASSGGGTPVPNGAMPPPPPFVPQQQQQGP